MPDPDFSRPGRDARTSGFVDALRVLVDHESPSADVAAVNSCSAVLAQLGRELDVEDPERVPLSRAPDALVWRCGDPDAADRILLLGHIDTVWPIGTTVNRPFAYGDGRATGPGVYDMKAGLLVGLHALANLGPDVPVTFLVTGDEEIGSAGSLRLIEDEARRAQAVLVLEGAGPGGTLKSARKGWSIYTVTLSGRAAHAGLEPHEGRNALLRLAELVGSLTGLADPATGLTVTPTVARAGDTVNTVPDHAELQIDVRATTVAEQVRVDGAIRTLADEPNPVTAQVDGGVNRPPMEEQAATWLLERVRSCTSGNGLDFPGAIAVGGISDANLTAALGIPTLDGLGAVGGGPHADHEWVDVPATIGRARLLTALLADLIAHSKGASNGV